MDPLKREQTNPDMARLLKVVERLRLLDREVPGQVVSCFLYIASHNPCHKEALEEDLGFTTASSSRNIDWLTTKHRLKKPGMGVIIKQRDPLNGRRLILKLSPKGEELIENLTSDLYD